MSIRLDHVFILTDPEATVGDRLVEIGLRESAGRVHKGQGTANRRFEFSNFMLELLWVHDRAEASNGPGANLRFAERSHTPNACPFGLIFGVDNCADDNPPFDGWQYYPDYFPPDMAFHVGANSDILAEPLCIYAPFFGKPVAKSSDQVTNHRFDHVTGVRLQLPIEEFSAPLLFANNIERLEVVAGDTYLLEVVFDNNRSGGKKDCCPWLPLTLYW